MIQPELFDSATRVLVDDATGYIAYTPNCISAEHAQIWFEALLDGVAWRHERRRMYERDIDVPRLVTHYWLNDTALPFALSEAAALVSEFCGIAFDSVGLNRYRDGRDSVAPHNDKLKELADGFPIAVLSLGAMRPMTIRAKTPPRRVVNIELEAGSLLVMSYESQRHFTHGIPKVAYSIGPRISLAFRVRPARDAR